MTVWALPDIYLLKYLDLPAISLRRSSFEMSAMMLERDRTTNDKDGKRTARTAGRTKSETARYYPHHLVY